MSQIVNGIAVNPALPKNFDSTPNDQRPASHQRWWHKPYIVTDRFEPESFEQYRERLKKIGFEPSYTAAEWREKEAKGRASWYESFPSGTRYIVRCLDGGAWDRSTNYGIFGSLDAAISEAQKRGNL